MTLSALPPPRIRWPTSVLGDYPDVVIGDNPGMTVEVWVETADLGRAEAILRQHRDHSEEADPSEYQTENPGS